MEVTAEINKGKKNSAWCSECGVALDANNPVTAGRAHYRSRSHLNRLLQLGVEIPFDDELADSPIDDIPQKIAYCVVCETSIGTPVQAAAHYRGRDHLNRRLQRGLPVVEVPSNNTVEDRDRFNQCLRRGVPVQPVAAGRYEGHAANSIPATSVQASKNMNGKRKLPLTISPAGLAKSSQSGGMPIPSFINEKRSRSQGSVPKSYSPKVLTGSSNRGFSHSHPMTLLQSSTYNESTGSAYWNPAASETFSSPYRSLATANSTYEYDVSTFRSPEFSSLSVPAQFYGSRNPVATGQWTTLTTVADRHDVPYTDGWYCDLCNIPLPTAIALNMHTASTEHKLNEMRSSHPRASVHMAQWT